LPADITENDLIGLFAECGTVTSMSVRTNRQGKGYAFVHYKERKEAEEAMERYKGLVFQGKNVSLDWDIGLETKRKQKGRSRSR
jgi:RNA recognition motif-containing protein